MIPLLIIRATHDELRRRRVPDGRVLAGLAKPGSVFLSDEPARLMLEPIQRPCQHGSALVPNDLLMVNESYLQQSVQHLARELGGVPNICGLETRYQREGFGPVGASVAR